MRHLALRRRTATLVAALGAALTAALVAPVTAAASTPPPLPAWFAPGTVWTGDFGDPTVVRDGSTYYAYASPVGGRVLPVLTSTDTVTWRVRGRYSNDGPPGRAGYNVNTDPKIPLEIRQSSMGDWGKYDHNDALVRFPSWGAHSPQGPWITRDYWAPGVFNIGATWYAYSPVRVAPGRFCLTVATAPSPTGPFRDVSGAGPIQCAPLQADPGGSIDPFPFRDPATGRNYLLWSASGKVGSHPSSLQVVELGANGLPVPGAPWLKLLETDPGSPWEGNRIENPSMAQYNGTWYLFYSGNLSEVLDAQGHSNYASGYAICAGPIGPCHRAPARVPLLSSSGTMQGPGGSSGFVDHHGKLRMAYASFFLGENIGGSHPHPRRMGIATLVQNADRTLRVEGAATGGSEIRSKWLALGGTSGTLGAATSAELPTPAKHGAYQHFQRGSLYWSPTTGSHLVKGAIRDRWASTGWENSPLGFPVNDEAMLPRGAYNHFQGGSVYWSAATGAQVVRGVIRERWANQGWEGGWLGYPTTGEVPVRGGAFNHFQGGSVYWSPTTGAHSVRGAIRDAWARQGWEAGRLGFPTSEEHDVPGGRRSWFQRGEITWTPATGAVVRTW
ncbi:LGFP repeat-containing protein [Kineococcus xinjiangensis]|uniref:LGFP repeat-containing protein n=1 Tax=Kineococcus xinjiangensis TaxID=512762 RepID=A0A2S6IUB6_9ACTN|nr:family 43 glycosylhydrolase [Kineococcus xinjiangensis]PPK97770.1 LGFP repeat-containing protein [Kineococcus xinjiangensis]